MRINTEWSDTRMLGRVLAFESLAEEYDRWFERHAFAYQSELLALKRFVPERGRGLEVGVGTGRFASRLGVKFGIEPAIAMAKIAQRRGVQVCRACAEALPFSNQTFDYVLLVTTLCFLDEPLKALREAMRVLKPGGRIIIGMIDKDSPLGKRYESNKHRSRFYRHARFYSAEQVLEWLRRLKYESIAVCQTIFSAPEEITAIEPAKNGYGEGSFVVVCAQISEKLYKGKGDNE
jgi:ubiquinone/menaquinone biosynthesis C-methylase UbiE